MNVANNNFNLGAHSNYKLNPSPSDVSLNRSSINISNSNGYIIDQYPQNRVNYNQRNYV